MGNRSRHTKTRRKPGKRPLPDVTGSTVSVQELSNFFREAQNDPTIAEWEKPLPLKALDLFNGDAKAVVFLLQILAWQDETGGKIAAIFPQKLQSSLQYSKDDLVACEHVLEPFGLQVEHLKRRRRYIFDTDTWFARIGYHSIAKIWEDPARHDYYRVDPYTPLRMLKVFKGDALAVLFFLQVQQLEQKRLEWVKTSEQHLLDALHCTSEDLLRCENVAKKLGLQTARATSGNGTDRFYRIVWKLYRAIIEMELE